MIRRGSHVFKEIPIIEPENDKNEIISEMQMAASCLYLIEEVPRKKRSFIHNNFDLICFIFDVSCIRRRAARMRQVHPRISSSPPGISVSIGRDDKFSELNSPSTFTVWKKSLLFNGSGFTAFDSSGNVVMRVDNYASQPKHHLFIMDAVGNTVFTLRHKVHLI